MREHKHNPYCRCPMPFPLEEVEEGCWAVAQDGQAIVLGDGTTVRVIFNNLTRSNYKTSGGYRNYLSYMSGVCRVTIRPAALVLVEGRGEGVNA